MLLDKECSSLQAQAVQLLKGRWLAPALAQPVKLNPDELDATVEATLDAMLARPWRINKLPEADERQALLARVRDWVRRREPVRITLGFAPLKNPRAQIENRADWAEYFALTHLCAWHNHVQAVYPPGLRIRILFDDFTGTLANDYKRDAMDTYIRSIDRLVDTLGYRSFIYRTMRQSSFAWLFRLGLYQWAERRVNRWERNPANAATMERMLTFARRNLVLPDELTEEERERRHREASHRYRVYWEALQMSRFSRVGNTVIAMYMDGSQHHIRQQAALHVASVGNRQITQPWQGAGALRDNGKGELVPFVLTAGRREHMTVRELTGLDIVPLPGFETIPVCWEADDAGGISDGVAAGS